MWLDLLKSECFTMNCAMIKKLPAGSDGVVFENNVEDIVNRKESKALRAQNHKEKTNENYGIYQQKRWGKEGEREIRYS